ncbi:MAG: 1-deoxy-D-xylulose-5-phosphate reductoisomerase [Dehalococcoidia bacterium]|nr:1-deoxy-D-xylulose-5-phosphate reductoisomerase [Dehalococcoidia bacterium]
MTDSVKKLALLGSTGSIGQQTLDVVRALPDRFSIIALAAGENLHLLYQQIKEFKPRFVYYQNKRACLVKGDYELMPMDEMACLPEADIVVAATSGKSGLAPTLAAVKAGKKVALSNKEALVMAGAIVTAEARRHGACILPVDSEHSAIWQCLNGETKARRIILTASGGPFFRWKKEQLESVTVEQTLNHPSWKMGKKITVDSASLFNKGIEVIEAHWLFDMPYDSIEVVIHPQSIVHSMVEYADGSLKAQLSYPDMRMPIQYALSFPERLANSRLPRLNLSQMRSLVFEPPDYETFPSLKLAIEAGRKGGTYPAVLCAADEVAVDLFLKRRIKFTDIPRLLEQVLEHHSAVAQPTMEEIMAADAWATEWVLQLAGAKP